MANPNGIDDVTPREAAQKVLEGFDKGIFVRDVTGDGDPAWAIKLFPYMRALVVLKEFADEPESSPTDSPTP